MDDLLKSLEKLILCGCSKLKWLKKFPSTVRYINARFCFSLKPSPALVKLNSSSQPHSQSCLYDESNSELAFTILYCYLQGLLCCKTDYETCTKRKEDVTITEFQIIVRGDGYRRHDSLQLLLCFIVGMILFSCCYVLGHAFGNEKEAVDLLQIWSLYCLSIIMDGLLAVLSGVARGSGW